MSVYIVYMIFVDNIKTCPRCKREHMDEKKRCDDCLKRKQTYDCANKKRRVANGKCSQCPRPIDTNGALCSLCRTYTRTRSLKTRKEAKAAGMCTYLCGRPVVDQSPLCSVCKYKKKVGEIFRLYGLTEREYTNLLMQQNNACASCKEPFVDDDRWLMAVVDHNHSTKHVRGLLHQGCNVAYGHLYESTEKIAALLAYAQQQETFVVNTGVLNVQPKQ